MVALRVRGLLSRDSGGRRDAASPDDASWDCDCMSIPEPLKRGACRVSRLEVPGISVGELLVLLFGVVVMIVVSRRDCC